MQNEAEQSNIDSILHSDDSYTTSLEKISKFETNFSDVSGLKGSLVSFFIKDCVRECEKNSDEQFSVFIVVPTLRDALLLKTDFETIFKNANVDILTSWGVMPYRPSPVGSAIFGERAGILSKMAWGREAENNSVKNFHNIFIITQKVFMTPLPSPTYIKSKCFCLCQNQKIDTVKIAEMLTNIGYFRVPKVSVKGEFSLRGEVLDIFLPDRNEAVRITFDFDTIEKIKSFDTENQATTTSMQNVLIYPMKEVLWDDDLIEKLETFVISTEEKNRKVLNGMEKSTHQFEGEEIFYPLLWDKKYSIVDYIGKNSIVFLYNYDRLFNAEDSIMREMQGMFNREKDESDLMLPKPESITFPFCEVEEKLTHCIKFRTLVCDANSQVSNLLQINADASQSYFGNINYLKEELQKQLQDGWRVFIFADNENQALRINEMLKSLTDATATTINGSLTIIGEAISEGFIVPEIKLRVIQENEIFSRKKYTPKSLQKPSRAKSSVLDTFVELNPGDYVVHVNYGIGIFRGIDRVKAGGNERDYVKLEYADEEFVFVPIEQVNLVQRYIGNAGNEPHLDRIGSKAWEARKNKVRGAVEEIANKLIDLYSRRKASRGFPFPPDTEWQVAFEAAFPYEDTPDQITATAEIKADMEKPLPMDRLICGDVGYGKTEVALRAAFKAVMGGKQVAFLCPTTILAEQHYETCLDRFKNFPVQIARLSRFVSAGEQKKILKKLQTGEIDVLVGTHRIIQKDVVFKNLGLMIIDEEQRFGVRDKEKLKSMKTNIDCLAMSATPIPRTLHMSLLKIRDMSLLTTPPQNRQAIETVIDEYSDEKVAEAIRREVERGGQVFYLHNRIESLNETRLKLSRLLPEMMIDVSHGQMSSEELDDIFHRFKMGGFHVLVSTTIIENGIDIPNVNTIIIDRADMYGVSQLYQLRGRVGRSDKKAFAYLLYPENRSLSEIAMKRLQVISDFTELGSGFKIAMKDMEIRGAGNLLGRDQSGEMYSVGFDMYMRLLNEAVNRLTQSSDYTEESEVLLELEYSGFIPDSYVQNPQIKMEIYKKIASIQTDDEFDTVYIELTDRFGPLTEEVSSLLSLSKIRILCKKLNVSRIKEKQGKAEIEFTKVANLSIEKVLNLIKSEKGLVRLNPEKPNTIILDTKNIGLKEKSEYIKERLERIV